MRVAVPLSAGDCTFHHGRPASDARPKRQRTHPRTRFRYRRPTVTAPAAEPVDVGSRLELFVDDVLIDRMDGVAQRLCRPVPREPAIVVDRPWESPHFGYVTVFADRDLFKMYYRAMECSKEGSWPSGSAYAESTDGIHWTKPVLDIADFRGSTANNLVWNHKQSTNPSAGINLCPFRDDNPEADPAHRYKAVIRMQGSEGGFSMGSPDGLHWKPMTEEPNITDFPPSEMTNHCLWDTRVQRYVMYLRGWSRGGHMVGVRETVRSESRDFLSWSEPEWIDYGDAPDEHLYTFAPVQYHRAPHIYVAFAKRYIPPPVGSAEWDEGIELIPGRRWPPCAVRDTWVGWYGQDHGVSDGVFAASRDGMRWKRYLEAFLRPGRDGENWTDRNMQIAQGVLETAPDELSIYFIEHYLHPTSRIRRATLRLDGFVSIHAGYPGGDLVTKPLVFDGSDLVINHATSAAGFVKVQIEDEAGRALDGFRLEQCPEIYGDDIERVVRWGDRAGAGTLAGRPVRLRFRIRDADLYSLRFA